MNRKNLIFLTLIVILISFSCKKKIGKHDSRMIFIPAGDFIMGSDKKDHKFNQFSSYPKRKVYVKSFYISKYEITNQEYHDFIKSGGYTNDEYWSYYGLLWRKKNNKKMSPEWVDKEYKLRKRSQHPVRGLSYHEASAYAIFRGGRLPTEAEWEKAARGTDGRDFPWGNEFDKFKCNVLELGINSLLPVGSLPAGKSPYGIMDMCGNVAEWTYEIHSHKVDGKRIIDGAVARGGAFSHSYKGSEVWSRYLGVNDFLENNQFGIRLVKDP